MACIQNGEIYISNDFDVVWNVVSGAPSENAWSWVAMSGNMVRIFSLLLRIRIKFTRMTILGWETGVMHPYRMRIGIGSHLRHLDRM